MNRRNYQKELERILDSLPGEPEAGRTGQGQDKNRLEKNRQAKHSQDKNYQSTNRQKKKLLIHSCCAPCSSYVLKYLREYFAISVVYYNPNITDEEEYGLRVKEQERLIRVLNEEASEEEKQRLGLPNVQKEVFRSIGNIRFLEGRYDRREFFNAIKGLEKEPEGGKRCTECFKLRLAETARLAVEGGYDYFTTTLTISPMKDASRLNEIGERLAAEYGVAFLPSDFKKKNGYARSIELSKEYGLYRQNYCGCIYSRMEREQAGQACREGT